MSSPARGILYLLPPGKPDHTQPRLPEVDGRPRIPQSPQKENTCNYYALKMIREQYGKCPDESLKEPRKWEQMASIRRKQQTKLEKDTTLQRRIIQQLMTDPHYVNKKMYTRAGALSYLPRIASLRQHEDPDARKEAEQLFALLDPFCQQTEFDDLQTFFNNKHYFPKRNELNSRFLTACGIDAKELYKTKFPHRMIQNLETLTEEQKAPFLDSCAFQVLYQQCYQLQESIWRPSAEVLVLMQELAEHGPLAAKGMFGKQYYTTTPQALQERVCGRTVWYWSVNGERREICKTHCVVVVGAKEGGSRGGYVYFVDPLDGSDPADPEKQKIYVISYERFAQWAVNLDQEITASNRAVGYLLYGRCHLEPLEMTS